MNRILIVGGTGFIGYHLAKTCLKRGWKVSSLSIHKPKKDRYLPDVEYLFCDISKKTQLKNKLKKRDNFDYVVNLGGYIDHINKKKTFNNHFIGTKNLSKIFLKKKIKVFLQMGSSSEYGRSRSPQNEKHKGKPKTPYAYSKLLATNLLLNLHKKEKFPVIILRLYQAYGPRQNTNRLIPEVIKYFIKNKKLDCSEGKQFRDFIYVDDLISAILKCLKNYDKTNGHILNIGTGKAIKVKDIIKKIQKKIKRGLPQFGKIKLRSDEILKIYPSINKIKNMTNWYPKTSFDMGLRKTIKYYSKKYEK